jgi:exonuclease SbcC
MGVFYYIKKSRLSKALRLYLSPWNGGRMIPIKLTITGFLSYQETAELDFTLFDLACISGPNGAGKSSLLDAFTWVLFGQARKRDESLINLRSNAAEVVLVFEYEGNTYRVQRTLPKGKTTSLEFQILEPQDGNWKVLTGHTLRDTQAYIESTLRLDYETFVNASFFLQGKADQFTQQKPSDRKRILGNILGLEVWEIYRQRVNERRKGVESEITSLDGRTAEINAELSEEQARTERLTTLQADLKRLAKARKAQEQLLEHARKVDAILEEQRKLVNMLGRQLEAAQHRLSELESRLATRKQEREDYAHRAAHALEIEAAYANWLAQRAELERWDEVAARFREHEAKRQAPRMEIEAEKARLNQELEQLNLTEKMVQAQNVSRVELEAQIIYARKELEIVEQAISHRTELDVELQGARQKQADARAENPRLKAEMDQLKARIDQLSQTEGAACPLCGRSLETHDRLQLIDEIAIQGKEMGDRYRLNQAFLKEADQKVREIEAQITSLSRADSERLSLTQTIARLTEQIEAIQQKAEEWEQKGIPRMVEVQAILEAETYATEARQLLAHIDDELKTIGYDAAAHDASRKLETAARTAEGEYRALEAARAALQPLEREIIDIQNQLGTSTTEITHLQQEYDDSSAHLAAAEAEAPDLEAAERSYHELLEQENSQRLEVGAAQQKVMVLRDLKVRLKDLTVQREGLARLVGQYKQLDRAFGKDGVPALLIEQALPEIESRANNLLDRLSEGNMSVRFVTQAQFKDKKRDDLKETLDILISDGAGTRDYELYSGGEAFRVNFAIRLALSELLAKRAGARLQTLVVDEGFGSQDAMGRQHLIEAINMIKQDFAKVLVITHIDELKEAFPNRIEVEKTDHGSLVRVV